MSIRRIIDNFEGRLTNADRKILTVLLTDPQESVFLGVVQVAERAGVHATSVVRLAQKLGFQGYPEMRQILREQVSRNTGAERVKKRLAKMGDPSILYSLIASEVNALQAIPSQVSQEDLEQAATLLFSSANILVFGVGHAVCLADLMARRLRRSGYRASSLHHADWEAPESLLPLRTDDVLLIFATRFIPTGLSRMMKQAAMIGSHTVVISDTVGSFLRPQPEVLLSASRGVEGESQSLTVPMAIANALILEISRLDGGHSVESLERLVRLRREHSLLKDETMVQNARDNGGLDEQNQ